MSTIARTFQVGSTWGRLRVMVRLSFANVGADATGSPELWFGLLANPTASVDNGPQTSTTSHFMGLKTVVSAWRRGYVTDGYFLFDPPNGPSVIGVKIGDTETMTPCPAEFAVSSSPASIRSVLGLEFERSGDDVLVRFLYPAGVPVVDVPVANFESSIQQPSFTESASYLTSELSSLFYASDPVAVSVDESLNGVFNAVCFSVGETVPACYLSDVRFVAYP